MAYDDYLYIAIILLTIPFGYLLKFVRGNDFGQTVRLRYVYCLLVGLVLAAVGMRTQIWHCVLVIVVNYFIVGFVSLRDCPAVSMAFNLGYLLFFRSMHLLGFEPFTGPTNATQLILTLKMISLAFDAKDTQQRYPLLPYLSYSFSFFGFFSGPFYRFHIFKDAIINKHLRNLGTIGPTLKELTYVPLYCFVFVISKHYFPVEYLSDEGFQNHPGGVLYRLAYLHPLLLWYRLRFYIAWQIAVAGCVAGGLGAYPKNTNPRCGHGPTKNISGASQTLPNVELDFSTIQQLRVCELEKMTSAQEGIKHWNMTMQYWMYYYIYKQFPWKNYRLLAVAVVAAYWHGLHTGYYIYFVVMIIWMQAQDSFVKATGPLRIPSLSYFWTFVDWFVSWNIYCYHTPSFRLLTAEAMWTLWSSVYFVGHIWCAVFLLSRLILPWSQKTWK